MASHLSWFSHLLFLLLMLVRAPTIDTRPASAAVTATADLIAGNEFLKLLFERGETQRELHSGEHDANERAVRGMGVPRVDSSDSSSRGTIRERRVTRVDHYEPTADPSTHVSGLDSRGVAARSLNYKSRNMQNEATATTTTTTTTPPKVTADVSKQVVRLVTSGSKIVFPEEYDDNDAVVDAVARDIDLQKENVKTQDRQTKKETATQQVKTQHGSNPRGEIKVVAVSVSSSSKRGGFSRGNNNFNTPDTVMSKQSNKFSITRAPLHQTSTVQQQQYQQDLHERTVNTQSDGSVSAMKLTLTTTPPTAPMTASATSTMDDFVNRSHKSEFSIEEAVPLTMSPQKLHGSPHATRASNTRSLHTPHAVSGRALKMAASLPDVVDSENSASTNIQNVLAAPLVQSAPTRTATVSASATYHSGSNRNSTSSHINHNSATAFAHSHTSSHISADDDISDTLMLDTSAPAANGDAAADVEEKLLPFQTVIYHNTKEGHGPQSRSISYSSLSQNVEDLHAWRHTGILAEAQRNVSESLKPIPRAELAHTSEPAKFYSVPSKMYSEPSKFYSEPAKVYSEPAKVYGEPEKYYSEPAKVYGQPSKFYSEPSKVYSQPSKVYGEPAKTYWAPSAGVPTATTSSTTTSTTTTTSSTTTTVRPERYMTSRRPAIVSRIAFGEAQTSTAAPLAIDEHAPATIPVPTIHHHHHQQHQQQHHTHHQSPNTRFHPHAHSHSAQSSHGEHSAHGSAHAHSHSHSHSLSQSHSATTSSQPAQSQSQSQSHSAQSQPRRVLFNLDKLPYDLLNAPVQSSQHLLDPDFSHSPPAAVTYSSPRQRQCLESAFSASLSQSALQQQQQLQQQRQHSSLSDQHSNQNAKGLPNGDLVKCVSKYNQPSAAAAAPTATESSHHGDDDDLYTPTPEQNYEIEESVSVMTNGRAHGVQGNSAATTTAKPYRGGTHHQQQQQQSHYHGNANANTNLNINDYDDNGEDAGGLNAGGLDDGADADGSKTGNEDEDAKVAYVVEGRNYRKYRVEEKTDDGFIVGEYGVVDHNDGNLRGVRYTADSTINRSLIQKALLTFLKLK